MPEIFCIRCVECNAALGVSHAPIPANVALGFYCYLCQLSLADVAAIVGRSDMYSPQQLAHCFATTSADAAKQKGWRWTIYRAMSVFYDTRSMDPIIKHIKDPQQPTEVLPNEAL